MEGVERERLSKSLDGALRDKTVLRAAYRRDGRELMLEFEGRMRLFVDSAAELDLSLTGGDEED